MKWLFKWCYRLILLLVVAIIALVLFKDAIIKAVVEQRIRARTGMDVKIGRFSVGIFSPVVTIEKLKLYNRPEFGGTPFIDMPELPVVKNEAGQTNLVSLMAEPDAKEARKHARDLEFAGIDVLNLSLGKV